MRVCNHSPEILTKALHSQCLHYPFRSILVGNGATNTLEVMLTTFCSFILLKKVEDVLQKDSFLRFYHMYTLKITPFSNPTL